MLHWKRNSWPISWNKLVRLITMAVMLDDGDIDSNGNDLNGIGDEKVPGVKLVMINSGPSLLFSGWTNNGYDDNGLRLNDFDTRSIRFLVHLWTIQNLSSIFIYAYMLHTSSCLVLSGAFPLQPAIFIMNSSPCRVQPMVKWTHDLFCASRTPSIPHFGCW